MSQYRIGTCTFTNGSATVTGQGTSWLGNVSAGNWIVRQGFGTTTYEAYQVASVASNTSLTLTAPYGGTTAAAVAYVITVDMLPNGIPELSNGDLETATIQNKANARLPASSFGTAATRDVMVSFTDIATPDALMPRGAFGLGVDTSQSTANNLNDETVTGWKRTQSGVTTNAPPSFGTEDAMVLTMGLHAGVGRVSQIAFSTITNKVAVRSKATSSWSPWRELYHTGNLQVETSLGIGVVRLMKNTGTAISNEQSVSGANLKSVFFSSAGVLTESVVAVTGTWKNVSGGICESGVTREFVRIA